MAASAKPASSSGAGAPPADQAPLPAATAILKVARSLSDGLFKDEKAVTEASVLDLAAVVESAEKKLLAVGKKDQRGGLFSRAKGDLAEMKGIVVRLQNRGNSVESKEKPWYTAGDLGDKVKALEKVSEGEVLPPNSPFVVRLDGAGFSKFTKQFDKPCDNVMAQSMRCTTEDLVEKFQAVCGYTASDEISLVFPSVTDMKPGATFLYKGRKQKLASMLAAFASVRFNHWLAHFAKTAERPERYAKLAIFDARVFSTGDKSTALDAIMWRFVFDTYRNGVSAIAQSVFSHQQLDRKSTQGKKDMLRGAGVTINDYPPCLLYGVFVKRDLVDHEGKNLKTGEVVQTKRTVMKSCSYNLRELSREEQVEFVFRKYWTTEIENPR